ncbi:uncharacterized protein EV154DRAFT_521042 [Mucor mucedo]|uniref:uncharacterized protein n=1 Tax=Mucor mucedo TaxID=29922 RepID=UPI0022209B55|nr:uncharacterized protein EV154DRAFT_521042 [Mucor mucedo]KAI7886874.1 hypothetical protein EV154DRAFT_521042 [Mucor mucedo]
MSFDTMVMCPATCELCGQWMPRHSENCPRSGVHPSQWSLDSDPLGFSANNNDIYDNEPSFILFPFLYPSSSPSTD